VHGLGHKGFEKHYGISEHELLELSNKQSSSLFVNN
jgi:hypothetical protein